MTWNAPPIWCTPILAPTPALPWPLLAQRTGAEVFVKHENHLPTGAFKVRGGIAVPASQPKSRPAAA